MSRTKVLVVEDEGDIRELIRYNLAREGFEVALAETGERALAQVNNEQPDLIVLDLMLPELSGMEVCRRIRRAEEQRHIPIVMVTARGEEADIVAGLELGADDYITKPFSPKVLLARIQAVLRRQRRDEPESEPEVVRGELRIHAGRHEVFIGDEPVDLTKTEFRVLSYLARRPGWVFTRGQIVDAVHGEGYPVTDRSVDVQIVSLRKKLGRAGNLIETVRGVGYRFAEPG